MVISVIFRRRCVVKNCMTGNIHIVVLLWLYIRKHDGIFLHPTFKIEGSIKHTHILCIVRRCLIDMKKIREDYFICQIVGGLHVHVIHYLILKDNIKNSSCYVY